MRQRQLGRKTRMKRGGKPMARARMKPKRRTKAEQAEKFAREYGSKERVEWISAHGCIACGRGPSENAHTAHPSAGMARKADACSIVPLCSMHHRHLHQIGAAPFERINAAMLSGLTLAEWADRYQTAWEAWSAQ